MGNKASQEIKTTKTKGLIVSIGLHLARVTGITLVGLVLFLTVLWVGFEIYDRSSPPLMDKLSDLSVEISDREGRLLRAYRAESGHWRLLANLDAVDPEYIDLLLAYEDKRFWQHVGVDPLAVMRATWQFVSNGRIVSGASTITMQLARLLEPRERRTFAAKIYQMVRALQLERRLSKQEILSAYLTLAPFGGNLEGIRAASLGYFAKEPGELTLSEAALLVALPQSPEWRRPDQRPKAALKARNNVLTRASMAAVIDESEAFRAQGKALDSARHALPRFAAHASDRLTRQHPDKQHHMMTLSRPIQSKLERLVRETAEQLGPKISVALLLADARNGEILAEVGSPDYVDQQRAGWLDMTRALRSPGSALKPFIYGLAFEEGLVRPATLIRDRPINLAGYRPRNFDLDYQGDVSVQQALLQSLNVPAVALLDAVGPARLLGRFKSAGLEPRLPEGGDPGLAIGLGGLGISLKDLTELYTAFVNGGRVQQLIEVPAKQSSTPMGKRLLDIEATWYVSHILQKAPPPEGAAKHKLAYKTGTSYGYRDAWSVGFDGRYVLGVWVGRADNSAVPGITGRTTAAPILFDAFARSGLASAHFGTAPGNLKYVLNEDLPPTLQRFDISESRFQAISLPEPSPSITYPPDGAQIELGQTATGRKLPLVLKVQDGRPPFRWMANGQTFSANRHKRKISWKPDGIGQSTLTVIDAAGRAASVSVFLRSGS